MTNKIPKTFCLAALGAAMCLLTACGGGSGGRAPGVSGGGVASGTGGGQTGGQGGGADQPHSLSMLMGATSQYFGTLDTAGGSVQILTGPGLAGYSDIVGLAYDAGGGVMYGFLGGDTAILADDQRVTRHRERFGHFALG